MPPDDVIAWLSQALPPWLAFPQIREKFIRGYAAPRGTIWRDGVLDVTIKRVGSSASIEETRAHRLPSWCPELHLYSDRTFCLGLERLTISSLSEAQQWWADVEVHLRLLSVALKTRVWPQHSALDHGDAGKLQRATRVVARRLGLEEELARAQAGEPSWIRDEKFELVSPEGACAAPERICPCGCQRRDDRPYTLRRCPRRREVIYLVLLERARHLELQRFWHAAAGQTCCGKVRGCPLVGPTPQPPDVELLNRTWRALQRVRKA